MMSTSQSRRVRIGRRSARAFHIAGESHASLNALFVLAARPISTFIGRKLRTCSRSVWFERTSSTGSTRGAGAVSIAKDTAFFAFFGAFFARRRG